MTENPFDFIPIGFNLYGFDLLSLLSRFNHHFGMSLGLDWVRNKPVLDLKPVMIMMHDGRFTGWGELLGKPTINPVKGWYEVGAHSEIINYVTQEERTFIRMYQNLKWTIPQLRAQLQKVVA